jgi:hypothetical protein
MTPDMNHPDERLSAALRKLSASASQGASPELHSMLKNAFRRHHARRKRTMRIRAAILCLCIAGLATSFLLTRSSVKNTENRSVRTIPPQEILHPQAVSASTTSHPTSLRKTSPRSRASTQDSAFVPLPSFDMISAGDELRVVRLELPGDDLRLVGAAVTEEVARRRVTADFVVGHDGTPYAVRLVQTRF